MNDPWPHLLELSGSLFEIAGAILLANRYLITSMRREIPLGLLSTLWNGPRARGMVTSGEVTEDQAILSLRGVLCLLIGFFLRTIPVVVALLQWLICRLH
jgi:hypothetical protein